MLPIPDIDHGLGQWSPTFMAPGTGFMEDNSSTGLGGGVGMVQAIMLTFYCSAQFLRGHRQVVVQ